MTYRDMTFCSGDGCARFNDCPRALTQKVKDGAKRSGWPISRFAEPKANECWASRAQVEGGEK